MTDRLDPMRNSCHKAEEAFNSACGDSNPLEKKKLADGRGPFLFRGFETLTAQELRGILLTHPEAIPAARKCAEEHWRFYLAYDGKAWLEGVTARWAGGKFSSQDVAGCELNIWKILRMLAELKGAKRDKLGGLWA